MSFAVLVALTLAFGSDEYFRITVVDSETGRGVPLVTLTTTNRISYVTDSAGLVAFRELGLMNERVFFSVEAHGYRHAEDGFGFRGLALDAVPGKQATIEIERVQIAERLYRVTGQGIYRDSVLLGAEIPLKEPLLNGRVNRPGHGRSRPLSRQALLVLGRHEPPRLSPRKLRRFGRYIGATGARRFGSRDRS